MLDNIQKASEWYGGKKLWGNKCFSTCIDLSFNFTNTQKKGKEKKGMILEHHFTSEWSPASEIFRKKFGKTSTFFEILKKLGSVGKIFTAIKRHRLKLITIAMKVRISKFVCHYIFITDDLDMYIFKKYSDCFLKKFLLSEKFACIWLERVWFGNILSEVKKMQNDMEIKESHLWRFDYTNWRI